MLRSLDVFLWDMKVGTLVATTKKYNEEYLFYFDPEFLNKGYEIAPLRASIASMSVRNGLPIFPETDKIFAGLPSFIADSLPDHWGYSVLRKWAASHHLNMKKISSLDLLAYVGRRGMGALEFIPPASSHFETPFKVEIGELASLATEVQNEANNTKGALINDFTIESLFKVGTSAGGRRPKAVINLNPLTMECYSGQVMAPEPGYKPMIIKFDEHLDIPSTRIEYSYYLMAKDAGLPMMPSSLLEVDSTTHFLTERFDRIDNQKIHTQTLAAMNPLSDSYEDLFEVMTALKLSPAELRQQFLHTTLNILAANVDDHNKNFSFTMDRNGIWHLSPAYDFTFTVNHKAPSYVNRHSISLNGKRENITANDLLDLARRFGIKEGQAIIRKVMKVVKRYREYAVRAGVECKWIDIIEKEINSRIEIFSFK